MSMSKKQSERIDKIESELQTLLKLQNAASQINNEKSRDSSRTTNRTPPTPLLEIMKPNADRMRAGSVNSTSSSQGSRVSNPRTSSKNVPYWQRALQTTPPQEPSNNMNVGSSDVMLSLLDELQSSQRRSQDGKVSSKPSTKVDGLYSKPNCVGCKENATERPRCAADCKGACNTAHVASRLRLSNISQLRDGDEATEKFERAIAELHQAEERHRIIEQQNARLRELLNSNRVVIKENVHSKRVALNVAKQLKDKYEAARADKHKALEQIEQLKTENNELLKRLQTATDSNNKVVEELKSRRKSSISQDATLREKLASKEEELERHKASVEQQIDKVKADKDLEIHLLKKENEYQLSKLDLEKSKELMTFKSELKTAVAKRYAELEKEKSQLDKNVNYKQELTMKEDDVKRLASALTDMSRRANDAENRCFDAEKNERLAKEREEAAQKRAKEAELKAVDAEIGRRTAENKVAVLIEEKENLLQELRGRLSKERMSEMSLEKYKEMLEENAKTRKNLENRCLELEKEVQQLKDQNKISCESQATLHDYQKMLVEKDQELKDYKALAADENKKMKIEWANMNNTVQELTEMLRSHKARVAELSALTKQQENLIATQQEALETKEEQVKLANQEVELVRNKSNELDNQVKLLRQSVRSFEKFREERERRSAGCTPEELEMSRRALENERDKLLIKDKIIEDQTETIQQLKASLGERLKELAEAREKVADVSRDRQCLTAEKERLENEVVSLQEALEMQCACDSSNDGYDKHNEMLKQLEAEVATNQQEWNKRLNAVTEEKENALKAARLATSKLVETVDEFKRQIAMHKKVQRMLSTLLSDKEEQLAANSHKACATSSIKSTCWLYKPEVPPPRPPPPPEDNRRCGESVPPRIRVRTSWSNNNVRIFRDKECGVSESQRRNWMSCSSK